MLYKKNTENVLSKELFKNPTAEYRGTPFWSWNCDLDEGVLGRQIDALGQMGFGGFHMHPRSGMSMNYLSDDFMDRIKFCVDKAKDKNMLAWLYDEDRWPSGAAGGLVTRDKKYRAKYIVFHAQDFIKDDVSREEATRDGKTYFAVCYDVVLDEEGFLLSAEKVERDAPAKGQKWYGYVYTAPNDAWFNDEAYFDILDEAAVERFIEITYERYKEKVGEEFDKTIPSIFADEPLLRNKMNDRAETPTSLNQIELIWSTNLQEKYEKMYGESIFDILPEVIWNLPGNKYSKKRHRYYDFLAKCINESYFERCQKWCKEHGIAFTGHVMGEQALENQTRTEADIMRSYRSFGIPGIDILCNDQELATAKQCQSIVHQEGKEAMLSELYGVTNYTFDFRGHKYQGDWLAALGVSIRVPHLSWVSMQGEAKRDYPASINYQAPWYKEYKYIEDHFARVNTALTRGKADVSVGVIHPIESYWLLRGPKSQSKIDCDNAEKHFQDIMSWLLDIHADFDFISESLIPEQKNENPKAIGVMEYNVIIVPDCITLRSSTIEYLESFKNAGGEVIFVGSCPTYVDAKESDGAKALFESSQNIPFSKPELALALKDFIKVSIVNSLGVEDDRYIYNMRTDGEDKWLFIAHRYPHNHEKWHKNTVGGFTSSENLKITVDGAFYPVCYDTITGDIKYIDFIHEKGKTTVYYTMFSNGSLLLKLCAKDDELPQKEEVTEKTLTKTYTIKDTVNYKRLEPNVLLLDIAQMALDEGDYDYEEEILRGYGRIRNKIGWPSSITQQPWVIPDEPPTHKVKVRMKINSEIVVNEPVLALELASQCEIYLNGKKVRNKVEGYYVDESIGKVKLPGIKKGVNELIVVVPVSKRTTIEYFYLLGEFNVRVEGAKTTIVPKTEKIGFGDISTQGLPFYGGNLEYSFSVDMKEDGDLNIHAYRYAGALLDVKVDELESKKIVFEPYDAYIKDLKAGSHKVTITCFGNRNNTFGALHWHSDYRRWFGPNAWRTVGDEWAYEYKLEPAGVLVSPLIKLFK